MVVITTTNGRPALVISATARREAAVNAFRYSTITGTPRTTNINTRNNGTLAIALASWVSASRSNFIPLTTKNNGIRNPNPTASSFDSIIFKCS